MQAATSSLVGATYISGRLFLTSIALKSVSCFRASSQAVVVRFRSLAVFLPGGDLGGGRRHVESDLHHADHGVECVVQFRERLHCLGVGATTPTASATPAAEFALCDAAKFRRTR